MITTKYIFAPPSRLRASKLKYYLVAHVLINGHVGFEPPLVQAGVTFLLVRSVCVTCALYILHDVIVRSRIYTAHPGQVRVAAEGQRF